MEPAISTLELQALVRAEHAAGGLAREAEEVDGVTPVASSAADACAAATKW